MLAHDARPWDSHETPALLDAVDTRWLPTGLEDQAGAVTRLFAELVARGAIYHDTPASVKDLAASLRVNRKTISHAAQILSVRGFLLRDTGRRPQIWRLRLRPHGKAS